MEYWRGLREIPPEWGCSVVTIGVFDGVHRGHQRVIKEVVHVARRRDCPAVVVTFDPHPMAVLRPDRELPLLTTLEHKAQLLAELGIDGLCVLPFTREFSQLSPEDFVQEVLVSALRTTQVIVGENFRFGHRAAGDVTMLSRLGQQAGFAVHGQPLIGLAGNDEHVLSSSFVRNRLATGDVETAAAVLGRPHRVDGIVVRGQQRGKLLGFPTANVRSSAHAAIPADGVYAGYLVELATQADQQQMITRMPAAISVGSNPTFGQQPRSVEAYVLDFDGWLYERQVGVEFVSRLRDMETFNGADALKAQIAEDVNQTRKVLRIA